MSLTLERPLLQVPSQAESPFTPPLYEENVHGADMPRFSHFSGAVALGGEVFQRNPERQKTLQAIESLAVTVYSPRGQEVYYEAADPGYRRYFTRDSIKTGMMAGSDKMLQSQIAFSVQRLGKIENPLTGEEPGKPPHEWPAPGELLSPFRQGRFTTYNACDTGAILLQGIAARIERGHPDAAEQYGQTIQRVTSYIKRHTNRQGLFIEDPAFAGDTARDGRERRFALKVTDWKDSELNRAGCREPHYPIVYTIAHFQNANALQRIGYATGNERLARFGRYMTQQGLAYLWRDNHFVSSVDGDGEVDSPSTDSLEALLYIPPQQLPIGYAKRIEQYSAQLETDAGYRAGIPAVPDMDMYHMKVWVHSQAELNAAACLHNLTNAVAVTERVQAFIDQDNGVYPELVDPDTYNLDGNAKQLWAMGADLYFLNPEKSSLLWTPPTRLTRTSFIAQPLRLR